MNQYEIKFKQYFLFKFSFPSNALSIFVSSYTATIF